MNIIDSFLKDFDWERFKGLHVSILADCWSLRAYISNSGGYFKDAVEAATNGLKVDEKHVNSLHARGYAYIQLGKYNDAKKDLELALEVAADPVKRKQLSKLFNTLRARD
jgi:tetratricopeptide (TPR) repeat protein